MQIFLKRWQVPSSLDRIIRKKILAGGFTHGAYKDKESYSYIKKNRMGHSARVDDPCRRYQSTGHIFFPGSKGLCLVGNHLSGILF
jgi:hypothetical protein